jgi:hypothetical protein
MLEVAQAQVAYDLSLQGHHMIAMAENGRTDRVMGTKTRMPELLCSDCGLRVDVRPKSKMSLALSHNSEDAERAWDASRREHDVVAFLKCELVDGRYVAGDVVHYAKVGDLRAAGGTLKESHFPGPEGNRHYINWPASAPGSAGVVKDVDEAGIRWAKPDLSEYLVKVPPTQTVYVRAGDFFAPGERLFYGSVPQVANVTCNLAKAWDAVADLASSDILARYAAVRATAERARTQIASLNVEQQFEAERKNPEKAAAEGWRSVMDSEQVAALAARIQEVETGVVGTLDRVWMSSEERFQIKLEALLELCRLAPERYVAKLASQIDRVRVMAFKSEILVALGEVRAHGGALKDPSEIAVKALQQVARSANRYPEELRARAVQALGAQARGDLIAPYLEHSSLAIKRAAAYGLEEAQRRGWQAVPEAVAAPSANIEEPSADLNLA